MIAKYLPFIALLAAILAAWGAYGFDAKPIQTLKYGPAFVRLYPWHVAGSVILFVAGFLLVALPASRFSQQARRVGNYVTMVRKSNDLDNVQGITHLMRASYALNSPLSTASTEKKRIEQLFERYDEVREVLPDSFSYTENNNLNFHLPTQLYLFEVRPLGEYIYVITHAHDRANRDIGIYTYDSIPTETEILALVGNQIPAERLQACLRALTEWSKGKITIHSPQGYGQTGGNVEDIKHWLYGYLPTPLSSFDMRIMVADALGLTHLRDTIR